MKNRRAVDIPELRHDLLRRISDARGARLFRLMARDKLFQGVVEQGPDETTDDVGDGYRDASIETLALADLFYVTGQMTDLAISAAHTVPDFALANTDLPSPFGFIYFDKPIRITEGVEYFAAAWGPTARLHHKLVGWGVWVLWYGAKNSIMDGELLPIPLGVDHIPFTEKLDEVRVSCHGDDEGEARTLDISRYPLKHDTLRTAWLLMQQEVTTVSSEPLDRHTRKRLTRAGVENLTAPRVVALRRQHHPTSGSPGDRHYHHQWIVNGHWRRQWYGREERHKPIWIAPHIKGPEGAPILGGDKVYAWRR